MNGREELYSSCFQLACYMFEVEGGEEVGGIAIEAPECSTDSGFLPPQSSVFSFFLSFFLNHASDVKWPYAAASAASFFISTPAQSLLLILSQEDFFTIAIRDTHAEFTLCVAPEMGPGLP